MTDQPPIALWGGHECTINRIGDRFIDQSVLSGHNDRGDDLERFAGLGLKALRYPLLWETFAGAADPERLWAWHDARLERLSTLGVRPIVGLVHHGSGPAHTSLLDPVFADGLATHAATAARRYPWVRDWTPVNEPLTTARFSALYGHWYPHLRDERSFWLALFNQVDGTRAAMAAIRREHPGARLIQTEDLGRTDATPQRRDQAAFDNERRWATWDMLAGRFDPDHALWHRLVEMGFEARLRAIHVDPCVPDVLGLNHYLTSDRFLDHRLDLHPAASWGDSGCGPLADVASVRVLDRSGGIEGAVREAWDRYRIPIALTEVHNGCTREEQMRWLAEAWGHGATLRGENVEIEAVTVWSLLGAHDWDSLLTRTDGHYESGVFDVRSDPPRETVLAPMIRDMAAGRAPRHPTLSRAGWWRRHEALPSDDMRPLLITGASGTLGQAFAGGCRLRGLDHVMTGRDMIDLDDPASMRRTLDLVRPWAVINCAGWVRVDEAQAAAADCIAANFHGCIELAQACSERGIHFTGFSSDLVFDGLAGRAYVETDLPAPLGVYGASKAAADEALAGTAALMVRTASFFSPYDRHNFAVHLVDALREGRRFAAAGDCVTSPTYVPDLVRATLDLIIDGETGLWHLVSDGALSWADFARRIALAMDLPANLIDACPAAEMGWIAPRPLYAALTSARGLIMPSLQSAIDRFAATLGDGADANRVTADAI